MAVATLTMSHSPLLDFVDPPQDVTDDVEGAFAHARAFAEEFAPDLVISFAPDHYNGFFYDIMPSFAVGLEAESIGDFGTHAGRLSVESITAASLAQYVLNKDVDLTVSLDMQVDHGAVQPLEIVFGGIDRVPVIPIFINSVAPPFGPVRRVRRLGAAIGSFVKEHLSDRRVLLVGSGGLSHEPPVPQIATADAALRASLLGGGRNLSPEGRAAREERVITAAHAFAAGTSTLKPLAPEWDRAFLDLITDGRLEDLDAWTPDEMTEVAGNSSHEVRTWIAAYSALAEFGPYSVDYAFYRPIPEYIAGFGVTTAVLA
ncbi:3-carboxyethylcatechol 2,3-dioxygenase [Microbacterium pumilum]|uniref:2,3-dihydroxyphenylpropionate/2,3-dihydroxicinnamic acid 1,2-dioxygenase n=1 Tax=Microbacterium pumilum TaxID=344165 RepID=A0ABN2T2S0_9MICO